MKKGIIFALSASLIWSLTFVIPGLLEGFNGVEIVVFRYLFYGVASLCLFLKIKERFSFSVWKRAFLYSLIYAIGFYPCVLIGLKLATPTFSTMIMGLSPITVSLYGNWQERKTSFVACLLIFCGLLAINTPKLLASETPATWLLGIISSLFALCVWTWYSVANSRFLKQNPQINLSHWSTLHGVATLFWTTLFILPLDFTISKYASLPFLTGTIVLGVLCSWLAFYFWYQATKRLPVALVGQLSVCIVVWGLLGLYLTQHRIPPLLELLGVVLFLAAVILSVKKYAHKQSKFLQKNP